MTRMAAIGALRTASRLIAIPIDDSTCSQPGVARPAFRATSTMSAKSASCAGSWKSGDCHSLMLARPQSPAFT